MVMYYRQELGREHGEGGRFEPTSNVPTLRRQKDGRLSSAAD